MNKPLLGAIATIIGTIIGAGVLGIPYVFAKAGVLLGLCNLVFIGLVVLLMNLMLGEVALRTSKPRMLPMLANRFLGRAGKNLMFLSLFVGIWGALIAYLIGVGESFAAIYGQPTLLGISANLAFSLLFFVAASTLVYLGLKTVTRSELVLTSTTIIFILALAIFCIFRANLSNLTTLSLKNIFLPYGVVLFSILGTATIPEVRRILENDKKSIKLAILIGTLIPLVLYALFAIAVVGVTGAATTEIATIGLGESLGSVAILLGNLFAIFAMASSFIILGLALKDSITDGFGTKHYLAFLLTITIPLAAFLLGAKSFISVIGITGALAGGLDGILVALIWRAAKKKGKIKPEYKMGRWGASYLLIIVFSLGIIYTILSLLGVL